MISLDALYMWTGKKCRELWADVILRALIDVNIEHIGVTHPEYTQARGAYAWFQSDTAKDVCSLVGVSWIAAKNKAFRIYYLGENPLRIPTDA